MPGRPGIIVEGLWKKFHRGELHDSLRDLLPALTRRALGRDTPRQELASGDFWALRNVHLSVQPGEALGVIGPNGAGKSTLLKVLTGILRPNRGGVAVHGRIGALIELAAGFHPDLTGRENVFLQGAIMGMPRAEIRAMFDRIVAFAGVEPFVDTPVKRYSSGMHARLGFAIAAHLDPDVLLVDEVLAVGDRAFQARAFERMRQIVGSGIPVVVVSHQLERVATLCDRAVLLDRGQVAASGTPAECIRMYVTPRSYEPQPDAPLRVTALHVEPAAATRSGGRVNVRARIARKERADPGRYSIAFAVTSDRTGERVFAVGTRMADIRLPDADEFEVVASLQMNVSPGTYYVTTEVWDVHGERRSSDGPSRTIHVGPGAPFDGPIQLNGRLAVFTPADTQTRTTS